MRNKKIQFIFGFLAGFGIGHMICMCVAIIMDGGFL